MATIYYTGCSLDGFIATPEHSLDWLVSRDIDPATAMGYEEFAGRIGACAMGASTWAWVAGSDEDWQPPAPTWVFTHRDFPPSPQVSFVADDVREAHAAMLEAAGGKDLWIIGGGDLAGQFHDAGLLDEVWLQYAPVTLGAGHPVLPRHVELRLAEVVRNRDFACTRHLVERS